METPTTPRFPPGDRLLKFHTDGFSSSLLLVSLPSLHNPQFLAPVVESAARLTISRLTIVLFARVFNNSGKGSRTEEWDDVQQLLAFVYAKVVHTAVEHERALLDVDIILKGVDDELPSDWVDSVEAVFRVEGDFLLAPLPSSLSTIQTIWTPPGPGSQAISAAPISPKSHGEPSQFRVVALGGTFDHLHVGHKILLSMAAWIASEKLIVGITDDSLLKKKNYPELLQPIHVRQERVRAFLARFRPGLVADIVPISDVYGPTGWDSDIQALVVSEETMGGANSIAKHRADKHLPPLRTFVIDVISHLPESDGDISDKMSSTFIRHWIAEHGLGDDVKKS